MCNSYVNHLKLLFVNVLVLKSFLAVSTVLQNCFLSCIFECAFKLYLAVFN